MDSFKLLSRSTKLSRDRNRKVPQSTPSSGQNAHPQLFADSHWNTQHSRKRKRGQDTLSESNSSAGAVDISSRRSGEHDKETSQRARLQKNVDSSSIPLAYEYNEQEHGQTGDASLQLDERKRTLNQHKIKVRWLNPPQKGRRKSKDGRAKKDKTTSRALFPNPIQAFDNLQSRYGISKRLGENVADQGFTVPTEVQLGALPLLLDDPSVYMSRSEEYPKPNLGDGVDLLTVAPTGSGKTLAFMMPLLNSLQHWKRSNESTERHIAALILVPTKELASQIVNEGRKLAQNTGIKISQMRKGMRLDTGEEQDEYGKVMENVEGSIVKSDIVVSTPGLLQSAVTETYGPTKSLSQIRHFILDEGDVLLDPLFRHQTLEIWANLTNPGLRVSMWSATMGSNIEQLAKATINNRRQRLALELDTVIPEVPSIRLVVGLKDSAVPNVQHKLIYAGTEQGKLMGLRQLLHPTTSAIDSGPPLRPPFLVFTQTIERAAALYAELLYDIPAEAGGISRIAVLHADLSDTARDNVVTRFRKGETWILITTDLLSRGVDFRGINGVVNYDIPTSSAAYVHRVGRTGRAGREGGVAVTLYSKEDIPYMKHVTNIVAVAQKDEQGNGVQQWLLDALPNLSKNEKQNLKKRGIESRTARGRQNDPKAAKKARISTKSGFVRRVENKRRGAILGSQRRAQADVDSEAGDETDFTGFD